jgi:hypothetical protein
VYTEANASPTAVPPGTVTVFTVTSTASQGIRGQPDFVERMIQVTLAK